MKELKSYRPRIKSRHPSHNCFRPQYKKLPLFPFKSVIRFGSLTEMNGDRVEINTTDAIKNSSNKLLMKTCFTENKIKTADWWELGNGRDGDFDFQNLINKNSVSHDEIPFPIISKHIYGSKGKGNQKHDNLESLEKWIGTHNTDNYIFEKFYNYNREYRLHVTEDGCFYTCRKMLKSDTPDDKRWYRNDDNSVWILEENEMFNKPVNWDEIVEQSVNALKSIGLDFGAIDLRIQSAKNGDGVVRKNPKFIVVEINSAPAMGSVTEIKYLEMLPKLLNKKYEEKRKEK